MELAMRWQIGPLLLLLAANGMVSASTDSGRERTGPDGDHVRTDQSVEVRRVHLPVIIEPRSRRAERSARCSPARPEDILISEDGATLRVTAVERSTLDVLHVILLDTSASMRRRLARTKETAIRYLSALPSEEEAVIASFDDNLTLHAVPQGDRRQLTLAVNRLSVGHNTGLWSSLYYLVRYLDTLSAHKVVILLSDGEDSSSMPQHSIDSIVEMMSTIQNLTLFSIGLDLTDRSWGRKSGPIGDLSDLSEATGGTYYEIDKVDQLAGVFEKIRDRLEHKYYASYVPQPFGEGPKDDPANFDSRRREIDVRIKPGVPCRIRSFAIPRRLERREPERLSDRKAGRGSLPVGIADSVTACLGLSRPPTFGTRIDLGSSRASYDGATDTSTLVRLRSSDYWVGQVQDISIDTGVHYDRDLYWSSGRLRLELEIRPVLENRTVILEVPAFDLVRESLHRPEDVILWMLRSDACRGDAPGHGGISDPRWVHGKTFLELREYLALAAYRSSEDYRDWARQRIRDLGWHQAKALLAEFERNGVATEENVQTLRDLVESRARNPEPALPQKFLAEWLGDVPARQLALGVQAQAANRALATLEDGGDETELITVVEQWDRFREWLPPPTHVRVVAPLVPAYDPRRDVFGFYRIVLPQPVPSRSSEHLVPPRPLGLILLHLLLDDPRSKQTLRSGIRVLSVHDRDLSSLFPPLVDARRLLDRSSATSRTSIREIRLRVTSTDEASGFHDVIARYRIPSSADSETLLALEPICIDVLSSAAKSGPAADRWDALQESLRASGFGSCSGPQRKIGDVNSPPGPDIGLSN
jgi:Mg-chelatase subunit ChlD